MVKYLNSRNVLSTMDQLPLLLAIPNMEDMSQTPCFDIARHNVILEISYTQKRRDLARVAQDYILGSGGNIRVVVGIDIDYKDKSATLSIWQPRLQANEAGEEELVAHLATSVTCAYL